MILEDHQFSIQFFTHLTFLNTKEQTQLLITELEIYFQDQVAVNGNI